MPTSSVPEPHACATDAADPLAPYDGVLLLGFGGPEGPEEVMPFLRRVTAGRGVPQERLAEVAQHYEAVGGVSPINSQSRALLAALRAELDRRGLSTPLLWGNRNSAPYLGDTLDEAWSSGMSRLVTILTSAYSSYSSCRQYREDLAAAVAGLAAQGRDLQVDKVRIYHNHPGFSRVNARLMTETIRGVTALADLPDDAVRMVFVTHSIPMTMDETSGPGDLEGHLYAAQHAELARAVTAEVNATLGRSLRGDLVYCSRSGDPRRPWLEPDVNDHLETLVDEGVQHVVVAPIGFVSDHMEVVFDLDTEAAQTAHRLGLSMARVPTVGVDPEFVSGLVDLLLERAGLARGEEPAQPAWPGPAAYWSVCPVGCCPNLSAAVPALCGSD